MDHEKKLELLKELDSTTDWQALINAKEEATKSQVMPQKPTRKLTRGEIKRKRLQNQLEQVKKMTKNINVQTVVFNNPDSKVAKANRSMRNSKSGQLAPANTAAAAPEEGVELNMREARHEIIKFGMSSLKSKDLEDAEASLAISLGARPSKRPAMNYRELQAQRKKEKESEKEMEANFSKPNLATIVKKKSQKHTKGKVGTKPKAGHGRSNNGNNSRQSRHRKV